jgi:ferredoxin--NADP+ reductase
VLAARGVEPVSYADWLRLSAAEEDLAASLGRGERVKLPHRDATWSAARSKLRSVYGLAFGHHGP